MVLLGRLVLQVLAFDAVTAATAQTTIQFVIVHLAIRSVIKHVKGRRGKRLLAFEADKARLVIPSGQAAIGTRDRLAGDGQIACFAVAS